MRHSIEVASHSKTLHTFVFCKARSADTKAACACTSGWPSGLLPQSPWSMSSASTWCVCVCVRVLLSAGCCMAALTLAPVYLEHILPFLKKCVCSIVGLAITVRLHLFGHAFYDFPAKNIVYTPHMYGSGQPYFKCQQGAVCTAGSNLSPIPLRSHQLPFSFLRVNFLQGAVCLHGCSLNLSPSPLRSHQLPFLDFFICINFLQGAVCTAGSNLSPKPLRSHQLPFFFAC